MSLMRNLWSDPNFLKMIEEVEPVTNRLPGTHGANGPVTLRSPQGPIPTPERAPSVTVETPQYGPDAADELLRARGVNPYPQQPLANPEANLPGYVPESQVNPGSTQMPATEMPATEMPATEMPATEMPATEPALPPEVEPVQVNMSNPEM